MDNSKGLKCTIILGDLKLNGDHCRYVGNMGSLKGSGAQILVSFQRVTIVTFITIIKNCCNKTLRKHQMELKWSIVKLQKDVLKNPIY